MKFNKKQLIKISIVTIIIFFISSNPFIYAQYTKLPISSLTEKQKEVASEIINITYKDCEKYFKEGIPSKIASSYFRERFGTIKTSKNCKEANKHLGEIVNLELFEVLKKNEYYYIRYKIQRAKTNWDSEIRIILNKKSKASGVATYNYWTDRIYDKGERLKPYKITKQKLNDSIINQQLDIINQSFNNCSNEKVFNESIKNTLNKTVVEKWKDNALKKCTETKKRVGNINDINFVEYYSDSIAYKRYRYKVQFDSLKKPSEIRLYSRLDNTYIGIWVIDVWYDKYIGLKKAREKSKNELQN